MKMFKILRCFVFYIIALSFFSLPMFSKSKNEKKKVKVVAAVEDEGVFQSKKIENTVGSVRFLMNGVVGSYMLYGVGSSGIQTPLLSSYDEFTSSFYSLKVGKKDYRLADNASVVVGARKSEKGAQLVYVVPNRARVLLKFEGIPHEEGVVSDIIKVTATVLNKGKKTETFALKSVLDTVLGEKAGPHFSAANEIEINSERQYRKMNELKWIQSSDKKVGMELFFTGADITPPEVVTLSNKDFLALPGWIPVILGARTFDSVLSYNNSAICINWESVELAPNEDTSFVYYIAVVTDGVNFEDDKIINYLVQNGFDKPEQKYSIREFEEKYNKALELLNLGDKDGAYAIVMELWEKPENRNDRLEQLKAMIEQNQDYEVSFSNYEDDDLEDELEEDDNYSEQEDNDGVVHAKTERASVVRRKAPEVTFDVNSIGNAQLNPKYIQGLIDRINMLENSDGQIERSEILRLNAELDAILEKLRQQ